MVSQLRRSQFDPSLSQKPKTSNHKEMKQKLKKTLTKYRVMLLNQHV